MPKQKVWKKVLGGFIGIGEMNGFYIDKHAKLTPRQVRDFKERGLDPSKQPKYTLWDQSHKRRKVVSGSLALVRLVAKNIVEYENRKAQGLPPLDKPLIPRSHVVRKNIMKKRTNPKRKSQAQKKAQSNAKKAMKIANDRGISLKQAWKIVKSKANPRKRKNTRPTGSKNKVVVEVRGTTGHYRLVATEQTSAGVYFRYGFDRKYRTKAQANAAAKELRAFIRSGGDWRSDGTARRFNPRKRKNTEKKLPCKFTKLELEIFDDVGGSYMDHIEDEFGTSPTNKVHSLNDIEFFHVIIKERSDDVERMRSAYDVNGLPFGMKPPSQNYLNRLYRLEAKLEKCLKKF